MGKRPPLPAGAASRKGAFVGHVEHCCVTDRPCLPFRAIRTIHQNRKSTVNSRRESRIAPSAKDRRCSGIWIDQREVGSSQRETTIIWSSVRRIAEEERAIGCFGCALQATANEHAELETTIDIGKEQRPVFTAPVLEIEQALHAA